MIIKYVCNQLCFLLFMFNETNLNCPNGRDLLISENILYYINACLPQKHKNEGLARLIIPKAALPNDTSVSLKSTPNHFLFPSQVQSDPQIERKKICPLFQVLPKVKQSICFKLTLQIKRIYLRGQKPSFHLGVSPIIQLIHNAPILTVNQFVFYCNSLNGSN